MQLVIEISEKDFENIATYGQCDKTEIMYAITHGIPLPEGHGRLIDADALVYNADYNEPLISKQDFDDAPTIIEANIE